MNDALCEHIVARKSKPMDFIIRILIIVVIVAVAIVGLPFLGFFAFALAAILALLAYYFAFPYSQMVSASFYSSCNAARYPRIRSFFLSGKLRKPSRIIFSSCVCRAHFEIHCFPFDLIFS